MVSFALIPRNVISRDQGLLFPQLSSLSLDPGASIEGKKPLETACFLVGSSLTKKVVRGERIEEEDKEQYCVLFRATSRSLSRSDSIEDAMEEISSDWLENSVEAIIVISRLLYIEGY